MLPLKFEISRCPTSARYAESEIVSIAASPSSTKCFFTPKFSSSSRSSLSTPFASKQDVSAHTIHLSILPNHLTPPIPPVSLSNIQLSLTQIFLSSENHSLIYYAETLAPSYLPSLSPPSSLTPLNDPPSLLAPSSTTHPDNASEAESSARQQRGKERHTPRSGATHPRPSLDRKTPAAAQPLHKQHNFARLARSSPLPAYSLHEQFQSLVCVRLLGHEVSSGSRGRHTTHALGVAFWLVLCADLVCGASFLVVFHERQLRRWLTGVLVSVSNVVARCSV